MEIINNKCSNCGYDGIGGWLLSSPVQCPQCKESAMVSLEAQLEKIKNGLKLKKINLTQV